MGGAAARVSDTQCVLLSLAAPRGLYLDERRSCSWFMVIVIHVPWYITKNITLNLIWMVLSERVRHLFPPSFAGRLRCGWCGSVVTQLEMSSYILNR